MYISKMLFAGILILLLTAQCSSVKNIEAGKNYLISYSSGGGFTGIFSGFYLNENGIVKFWHKQLNSTPVVDDSINVQPEQKEKIRELISEPEIFTYKSEFIGNYTTYLSITCGDKTNNLSFNKLNLPKDMPASLHALINELNKIHR